jgi:hypothetical protein
MPSPYVVPTPRNTPYEYVGDVPALGSLQLTKLARSYAQIDISNVSELFPAEYSNERTIVIETMQENLGLFQLARPGIPNGGELPNKRIFRRVIEPAHYRENDFIDQFVINQLRAPGTLNTAVNPTAFIQDRVRELTARHNRLWDFLCVQVLLGGINYSDPRSGVDLVVPTNIPAHNFFNYKGFDAVVAANGTIPYGGVNFTANQNLINDKGRQEALYFTSVDERAGVPWSDPDAEIIRGLRLLKLNLRKTNKNQFTDLYMSSELYTLLMENHLIKAAYGGVGTINYNVNATDKFIATATNNMASPFITFTNAGEIATLAGLRVNVVTQLYQDPRDGQVHDMWPSHKVALIARNHINDASQTLGHTQFCVGEAPDGTPGLWMRTGPEQMPPNLPGRAMQMGDSFLPYAMYPQWIAILDVCEPDEIATKLPIRANLNYGTF